MIATAAYWLVVVAGVWLIGLGLFMVVRPRRSLDALGAMGGSPAVHFGEMGVRIVAGGALMLAAEGSRHPLSIGVIGGFLIASAVVILLLPRRWHAAYSSYWAQRIPAPAVRLLGPISAAAGGLLIWAVR